MIGTATVSKPRYTFFSFVYTTIKRACTTYVYVFICRYTQQQQQQYTELFLEWVTILFLFFFCIFFVVLFDFYSIVHLLLTCHLSILFSSFCCNSVVDDRPFKWHTLCQFVVVSRLFHSSPHSQNFMNSIFSHRCLPTHYIVRISFRLNASIDEWLSSLKEINDLVNCKQSNEESRKILRIEEKRKTKREINILIQPNVELPMWNSGKCAISSV